MSKNICSKDLIIDAENSIIDLEGMQEQIKELEEYMNNQTYLAMHKHDIWQGSRGYYYTYLPDPVKGRILLKKKSKNDLTKAIVEYYKCHKSVNILFNEWLEHKLAYRLIKEPSAIRYEADYKRFIYGTDFGDTEVANVTEEMLEEFIISSIFDNELTAKAFSGLRTIIMGMFRYAKKKKYTALSITNFFGDLELSPNMFKHVAKNDEDEVFTDAEVKRISDYVKENPTIWNLAVLLAFHTGLRVGDDDDKIRLNQRKPSKYKGLSRFGPEKNLQRINKFMKERPTFYKKLIQMKENFRFYLRCFYCITKVVILQFNSEKQDRISS